MSSAFRRIVLALALTVSIQAHGPPGIQTKPEGDSLLEQLSPKLQGLLPDPLKSLLAQIPLPELSGLKEIAPQLPQLTEFSKLEELLQSKSPTILSLAKQLFQQAKDALEAKKAQLSPDSLQFFADLLGINKESLKKYIQLILGLKPEVKENLKITFPEIAELLKSPAADKSIPLIINATSA
ncbi:unnamed protein product [Bursaphelenchus xylophilus]|uniref:(pine wood nematode) hypothetical protein n=1 Tax=Bursaphelenchus xylophilus TaxID=6326 RepID=A0A1I7RQF5_BURXY|nr:unnamed protein product [Bursaphelenchus xylophilus]CAG9104491.1 unnamed protein product [Bursaphelenchus xylophilus]